MTIAPAPIVAGLVDADGGTRYTTVTFGVRRWFRPFGPDRIAVTMLAPKAGTSVSAADYAEGSRLLASGESRWGAAALQDPIAWPCGFSRTFEPDVAASWAGVFDGTRR